MSVDHTLDKLRQIGQLLPACEFKGVQFCDISPLLANPKLLDFACNELLKPFRGNLVDSVAGLEARGFIFGVLIAQKLGVPFVQLRKPGKLPGETLAQSYAKEYGTDTIEVQRHAIQPGQRVLLVDDILATGGTLLAACQLVRAAGGEPAGCAVIAELPALGGRARIKTEFGNIRIETLISMDDKEESE